MSTPCGTDALIPRDNSAPAKYGCLSCEHASYEAVWGHKWSKGVNSLHELGYGKCLGTPGVSSLLKLGVGEL